MDLIISTMHHWCNLTRCNRPRAINRVAEPSLQSFDELMRFDLTFMQQIRISRKVAHSSDRSCSLPSGSELSSLVSEEEVYTNESEYCQM
ncbi:hypothetical protein OUZ56_031064 [Daphnia magna]|uniref:Uncharacterized protein n=1 Tax=Daphnia magna TaxID=35525 RepID=A0ABQ9ZTN5_9CRUS|nr:hypothetical protein OUZ56_031064 [Daphnia magna]